MQSSSKRKTKAEQTSSKPIKRNRNDNSEPHVQVQKMRDMVPGESYHMNGSSTVQNHPLAPTSSAMKSVQIQTTHAPLDGSKIDHRTHLHDEKGDQFMHSPGPKTEPQSLIDGLERNGGSWEQNDADAEYIRSFPTPTKKPGPGSYVDQSMLEEAEATQFAAWMYISAFNDPAKQDGVWVIASLDTQASDCVIFWSKLVELGLTDACVRDNDQGTYTGLGRQEVKCIGHVWIQFVFEGRLEIPYDAKVDVLDDNTDDSEKPPFDILIGRTVLNRYGLVTVDRNKVPIVLWAVKKSKACESCET